MGVVQRVVGLLYVIIAGAALYYVWPDLRNLLRGTWFNDLYLIVAVVYVFAACWILEKVWVLGLGRFVSNRQSVSH